MLYSAFAPGGNRRPQVDHLHVGPETVEDFLDGLTDNMVVVLPGTCTQFAGIEPNINDKGRPKELWIGRLRHLKRLMAAEVMKSAVEPEEIRRNFLQAALYQAEDRKPTHARAVMRLADLPGEKLESMARAAIVIQRSWRNRKARKDNSMDVLDKFAGSIVKGYVVFVCGSTGIAGDSLRYMRMLGGMGYLIIAPDDLAGKSRLRRRDARLIIRPDDVTDYWQRNLLYKDEPATGEMVYNSSSQEFMKNPDKFDQLYNNVITVRQAEVSFTLRKLPMFIKRHGVNLFGMSEGAIVLSSFHDDMYLHFLKGRVLASYSCEQNYWNYNRLEDVGIAGNPSVPTLNMMGFDDEYFGVRNSIAATIAQNIYGHPPIHGHAFEAMIERGLEWGLVVHLEGGKHNLTVTHDDVIREILVDFLERPQSTTRQLAYRWSHIPELQDQVTRVKQSFNNQVLYVRIRPPTQEALEVKEAVAANTRDVQKLLCRLTTLLHEMDHQDEQGEVEVVASSPLARLGSIMTTPLLSPRNGCSPRGTITPVTGASPHTTIDDDDQMELFGTSWMSSSSIHKLRAESIRAASMLAKIITHVSCDPDSPSKATPVNRQEAMVRQLSALREEFSMEETGEGEGKAGGQAHDPAGDFKQYTSPFSQVASRPPSSALTTALHKSLSRSFSPSPPPLPVPGISTSDPGLQYLATEANGEPESAIHDGRPDPIGEPDESPFRFSTAPGSARKAQLHASHSHHNLAAMKHRWQQHLANSCKVAPRRGCSSSALSLRFKMDKDGYETEHSFTNALAHSECSRSHIDDADVALIKNVFEGEAPVKGSIAEPLHQADALRWSSKIDDVLTAQTSAATSLAQTAAVLAKAVWILVLVFGTSTMSMLVLAVTIIWRWWGASGSS